MRYLKAVFLIFIAVFCTAACGTQGGGKIAYMDLEQARQAHPRYNALKHGQQEYDRLLAYRAEQADIADKQLRGLALLQKIKQNSKTSYYEADYHTSLYAKEAVEQKTLSEAYKQAELETDAELAAERSGIEDEYQLSIFNLRLQTEALRNKPEEKQALENELAALKLDRNAKMLSLMQRRREIIEAKIAPLRSEMQERLGSYAAGLREEMQAKISTDIAKDSDDFAKGPQAFAKVLEVIDRRLAKIKENNESIAGAVHGDIEAVTAEIARGRGYAVVFGKAKVNAKADDITGDVIAGLKKIKTTGENAK